MVAAAETSSSSDLSHESRRETLYLCTLLFYNIARTLLFLAAASPEPTRSALPYYSYLSLKDSILLHTRPDLEFVALRLKPLLYRLLSLLRKDASLDVSSTRLSHAACYILGIDVLVDANGLIVAGHQWIKLTGKPTAPGHISLRLGTRGRPQCQRLPPRARA